MISRNELNLHVAVADFVRTYYPHVIFRSDTIAVSRLGKRNAVDVKRTQKCRGYPDLRFDKACGPYHALAIEIKYGNVFDFLTKKGNDIRSEHKFHMMEQAAMIEMLRREGIAATFAFGYDQITNVVDEYMSGRMVYVPGSGTIELLCRKYVNDYLSWSKADPFIADYWQSCGS